MNLEARVKETIERFALPSFYTLHIDHLHTLSTTFNQVINVPSQTVVNSFISEVYLSIFNKQKDSYDKVITNYVDYLIRVNKFTGDKYYLLSLVKKTLATQLTLLEGVLEIAVSELDITGNNVNIALLETVFSSYVVKGIYEANP